jgi:hypothetical protein
MRFVQRAVTKPMHCAVLPFIGQTHERGFIDTGSELPGFDNHVYISVVAAEEMARMVGFIPGKERTRVQAELDQALARVTELERDLSEAERHLEAVDLLESRGFTARKKPGRPKREETPA